MNNNYNKAVYKFYNELNEEEILFYEDGKYFIVVGGKNQQVSQAIFECYKKLCWKYDYNVRKHGNIISLDGHQDKMQDTENNRYSNNLEYCLLHEHKSVEELLIQKSTNEKIIEVANRYHNGALIIKRLVQGYGDTEMAKEIGISRKALAYQKKNCSMR